MYDRIGFTGKLITNYTCRGQIILRGWELELRKGGFMENKEGEGGEKPWRVKLIPVMKERTQDNGHKTEQIRKSMEGK